MENSKKEKNKKEEMCGCGRNPIETDHICPYHSYINGDDETLCNCCSDCERDCAMDV